MNKKNNAPESIRLTQGIAYASPIVVTSFLLYPVQIILAGMYAKYFGLALTTIASIVFAARLFDAVTDPVIGYLSDRYRNKTGTRKPWVLVGSLCLIASSYLLFVPPTDVTAWYFLVWYIVFYLAWTVVDIPHMAWGGELTNCSHEKTRIYSVRTLCQFSGLLLYTLVPMLPYFAGEGFTPETMKWSVIGSAVIILPTLIWCLRATPNGRPSAVSPKESPNTLLVTLMNNKPLLILLEAFF